ncbi:MAG TPA: hypothetical protein VE199_05450 [Nitrososphaera sp.]|nr:hypothetical protein [Nitrososphaera sp.]
MDSQRAEIDLDTYKQVRKKFIDAGDTEFGPGFISMAEYYFMEKTGYNPFAMLFSEPRIVYDEWIELFKGEEPLKRLFEKAIGPSYLIMLDAVKRNNGFAVCKACTARLLQAT